MDIYMRWFNGMGMIHEKKFFPTTQKRMKAFEGMVELNDMDYPEDNITTLIRDILRHRIQNMPDGKEKEKLIKNFKHFVKFCKDKLAIIYDEEEL